MGACLFYVVYCLHCDSLITDDIGSVASLRKQVGVNPIVQQSQEFSIQNEDFPALPGFKGMSKNIDACISGDNF